MAAQTEITPQPLPEDASVAINVSTEAFQTRSILAAAHVFIDRCFVTLTPSGQDVRVTLIARGALDDEAVLESIGAQFVDELAGQEFRLKLAQTNKDTMDRVLVEALASQSAPPPLDEPFDDEALDDPLGIAQSWEERYAPKKEGQE